MMMQQMTNTNKDHITMNVYIASTVGKRFQTLLFLLFLLSKVLLAISSADTRRVEATTTTVKSFD